MIGVRGTTRFRWWYWIDNQYAHARCFKSRGRALCGARISSFACYADEKVQACPKCLIRTGLDPLAELEEERKT